MECSKALRKLRLITDDLTLNGPQPANYQTRAGPAGSVCALGTLFLFSVKSRGFLKCKSSYNYVLTFKVQVGWITLLEKKKNWILSNLSIRSLDLARLWEIWEQDKWSHEKTNQPNQTRKWDFLQYTWLFPLTNQCHCKGKKNRKRKG